MELAYCKRCMKINPGVHTCNEHPAALTIAALEAQVAKMEEVVTRAREFRETWRKGFTSRALGVDAISLMESVDKLDAEAES